MREVNITYGASKNRGIAFVDDHRISRWYVVKGGTIVNKTYNEIERGCNVEELEDIDCVTSTKPINTLEQFENFMNS